MEGLESGLAASMGVTSIHKSKGRIGDRGPVWPDLVRGRVHVWGLTVIQTWIPARTRQAWERDSTKERARDKGRLAITK